MARVGGFITGFCSPTLPQPDAHANKLPSLHAEFFSLIKKIEVGAMTPFELRCRQTLRREELGNIGPRCLWLAR
jgi:hypothetical protein